MAASRSWMLAGRGMKNAKGLKKSDENKEDLVNLDFSSDPSSLMQEILSNICKKHDITSIKKLNYLNAFVHLLTKNTDWKSPDTFGFSVDEILSCLKIALIQDSVQVRAVGLRALRYVVRSAENVLCLNRLHFPYLIARSLDLLLKSDNERVLMSERIQSLKMMRQILSIAPQHFSPILVRPLISVVLRPVEETDRLLKSCIAVLCELCLLNCAVFIECDGVRALLHNATLIPSSHITEAICGALLFLLNKPHVRESANVDLRYLISGYTNSVVTDKNSFREEERRLTWTNFVLLTMLKSSSGIFELCNSNCDGLKSIVQILYLNKPSIRKAILEMLYELINIPQSELIEDEVDTLEIVELSHYQESFKFTEEFLVSEGEYFLPSLVKNRVNLVEVHTALLLVCLLEVGLPDALVEVIVSSDASVSLSAAILLGEFLNLTRKLLPQENLFVPPALPNLVSYAVRGCPLQAPSFTSLSEDDTNSYSNLYEQYSPPNFSHYSKDIYRTNDSMVKSRYSGDISTKKLDLRLSYADLNVPDNCTTKSSQDENVVTKDTAISSMDITTKDFVEDTASHNTAEAPNATVGKVSYPTFYSSSTDNVRENDESMLNRNRVDLPPCKLKQRMALSAVSVLSSLQKKFEKPRQPASLLLSNVAQYGERKFNSSPLVTDEGAEDRNAKKRDDNKMPLKELEELIKETGILVVPDASRWKWETIRVLLRLSMTNPKMLNDANFKILLKKLVHFYKPSSKKYSHTPLKSESVRVNIYTLVACDLFDILLEARINDGLKFLSEILEDIDDQLKQLVESKSVHDCLLSPLRLTNSLSQDYFLLLGRLSNKDVGLLTLQNSNMLQKLQHIATNIHLDCYVKLIISSFSYVYSEDTRRLYSSVLSCSCVSSRTYATKYLHVLLRTSASKHESFRNWVIEMLVNQLYDESQTIATLALSFLNEAADDKNYLDILISMRPSLLHLGDAGLLLLIRFLSTEKGFQYLQAANFVSPQLQRWGSSFNTKYVQIVEGDLHEGLTQYQRSDDGRYKKRITGNKARLKNVIVPPHLYGQLVQHSRGFELLMRQENIHKLIQTILIGNYDTDKAILELKVALWAMGHFATSSAGVKYLSRYGVMKEIVGFAETATVYSIKMTAFYVLSMIATTKEGVCVLNKTNWRCLERSRHDNYFTTEGPYASIPWDRLLDYDDNETLLSPPNAGFPQNDGRSNKDAEDEGLMLKLLNKFSFEKKSATLPQRNVYSSQIQHNRSFSESKADPSEDWSSFDSPSSIIQNFIPEIHRSDVLPTKSESCGTESSTSGISSCDSALTKPSNFGEHIPSTLSPIPSTSSLSTIMPYGHQKEHRSLLPKRHSSISFGCRLNSQNTLGYKTLRLLQNRHLFSNSSSFSASATIEYLSAPERRQMSPLVRPKFPRYLQKPSTPEFEIRSTPFDENVSMNVSCIESSRFSHSTEIDDDRPEFEGPCYQGICLPLKLSCVVPRNSSLSPLTSRKKWSHQMQKPNDDLELSGDSDSERLKYDDANRTFRNVYKRRRHDKSACLLCSLKPNLIVDRNMTRSRRTSTSSVHRIRTETESSYGGGIGPDNDSPIFLAWQQKPVGLVDNTPGGATCSTLDTSDSQSSSVLPNNNDPSVKSRSILRKEVLKLIEQLGNPVLYRTCKQGLLQLKQICGDLFQDICLFSDVCSMLGSINYRIQARQLIQDLFLDVPFHELYEEANVMVNRTSMTQDNEDTKSSTISISAEPSMQMETKSSLSENPSGHGIKEASSTLEPKCEERKNGNANGSLEVIIETDIVADAVKSERSPISVLNETKCGNQELSSTAYCDINVKPNSPNKSPTEERFRHLYDCKRAYSYPATNYVIKGFEVHDTNGLPSNRGSKIPTTRSRSVSATCSYISEIAMKSRPVFQYNNDSTINSFVLEDGQINNLTALSKHSVISFGDRSSPSVVFTFENPCNVLDLKSKILIKDVRASKNNNAFENDSKLKCENEINKKTAT